MSYAQHKVLIRSDSSSIIGIGHTMRDLVLAHELSQSGYEVSFACQALQGNHIDKIISSGYKTYPVYSNTSQELIDLLIQLKSDWVIFDHYNINALFEQDVKTHIPTIKVLSFDDTYQEHYCDILLNHGFQAKASLYKGLVQKNTKILCGSKYTLIKDAFKKDHPSKRVLTKITSILITLGGSDVQNFSLVLVRSLKKINPRFKITVITTTANPHLQTLMKKKAVYGFHLIVDTDKMSHYMQKNDMIISASGGTLFEVFALKKLFLNLNIASNQNEISHYLKKNKISTTLQDLSYIKLKNGLNYVKKNQEYILQKISKIRFGKNHIPIKMKELL